jgi:O-antigen ligase
MPADAGQHLLAWDMQQAGVADFSERAVPVALTRILVDAAAASAPQPVVTARRVQLYPSMQGEVPRSRLWLAALRIVADRPLLGVGPGAYRRVYGEYLGMERWDSQVHSNDLLLELAATTGLLGLGAFLATVLMAVGWQVHALRAARSQRGAQAARGPARAGPSLDRDARSLLIGGCLAATAAAFGHGLVDYFLVFVPTAIEFWVILGIGLGIAVGLLGARAQETETGDPTAPATAVAPLGSAHA